MTEGRELLVPSLVVHPDKKLAEHINREDWQDTRYHIAVISNCSLAGVALTN